MKILMSLFFAAFIALSSTAAMGVTIEVTDASGSSRCAVLEKLDIESDGSISVKLTSALGICDNNGGGNESCSNDAPEITVSEAPVTATVGTKVTARVLTRDVNQDRVSVRANYGSVSGSRWSWKPEAAGIHNVILTATDGKDCNSTATYSFNVAVTSVVGGNSHLTGKK